MVYRTYRRRWLERSWSISWQRRKRRSLVVLARATNWSPSRPGSSRRSWSGLPSRPVGRQRAQPRPAGSTGIDWPNSGLADPSQELGEYCSSFGRTDPGRARDPAGAYCQAGGPATVTRRGHFSMVYRRAAQGHHRDGRLRLARRRPCSPILGRLRRMDRRDTRRTAHPRAARHHPGGGARRIPSGEELGAGALASGGRRRQATG